MDNTLPSQSDNQVVQTTNPPQVPQPSVAQQPVTPSPIGSVQKEAGPIQQVQGEPIVASEPFIAASGAEVAPVIPPEVAEHGVEAVTHHETPQLTEEHRGVGIEAAKESVPVATTPSGAVQLPMTEEEAKKMVKTHKKVGDSILWLANIILKHAKMVHEKITQ